MADVISKHSDPFSFICTQNSFALTMWVPEIFETIMIHGRFILKGPNNSMTFVDSAAFCLHTAVHHSHMYEEINMVGV